MDMSGNNTALIQIFCDPDTFNTTFTFPGSIQVNVSNIQRSLCDAARNGSGLSGIFLGQIPFQNLYKQVARGCSHKCDNYVPEIQQNVSKGTFSTYE